MNDILGSNLKTILHSKRANLYYLEKSRVLVKDARLVYLSDTKDESLYWNIPIANTTVILLGTGTSITQSAVRLLASAGVMIGFCGTGGTPLFSGTEIEWLNPQSEYRPTEYVQGWLSFWFDESKRLAVAKRIQLKRIEFLEKPWGADKDLQNYGFYIDDSELARPIGDFKRYLASCQKVEELLLNEAILTKRLYAYSAKKTKTGDFKRNHDEEKGANAFLNHGNYLAYGLAASCLWVLGIPHGFAVMHGKTRRGALVFDIADLIKDALVLPWAFILSKEEASEQAFRIHCLKMFTTQKAMDFMFDVVKEIALTGKEL